MEKIKSLLFANISDLNYLEKKVIRGIKPIYEFNILSKGESFDLAKEKAFNTLKDLADQNNAPFAMIISHPVSCSNEDKYFYYGLVGSLYNTCPTIKSQNL